MLIEYLLNFVNYYIGGYKMLTAKEIAQDTAYYTRLLDALTAFSKEVDSLEVSNENDGLNHFKAMQLELKQSIRLIGDQLNKLTNLTEANFKSYIKLANLVDKLVKDILWQSPNYANKTGFDVSDEAWLDLNDFVSTDAESVELGGEKPYELMDVSA